MAATKPKSAVEAATDELRQANEAPESLKRSFPKKRPVGRPRKDGQPAGSPSLEEPAAAAGEPRVKLPEIPAELLPIVALAPLQLAAHGMAIASGVNMMQIQPGAATVKGLTEAFKAWLKSLEFQLTPGYALLIMYGMALTEMGIVTYSLAAAKEAEEKAKAKADAAGGGPSPGGGPGPAPESPAPAPASSPAKPQEDVPVTGPLPESVNGTDGPQAHA